MTFTLPRRLLLLAFVLLSHPSAWGDEPKPHSLTRLVDAQAGLVIRIQNFRHNAPSLLESRWIQAFLNSRLHASLRESGDVRKIIRAGKQIEEITGEPLLNYLNSIFGEDVVVALFPDDDHSPYGVLYTAAESDLALQKSIARWKRLEPQSDLILKHNGVEYTARLPPREQPSGQGELFYCALGRYFVLSDREQAVKSAIDLHQTELSKDSRPQSNSLEDAPGYASVRDKLPHDFWISLYFSPPRWKRALGHLRNKSNDPEINALSFILKHSQDIILGLRFDEGLFARLLVTGDDATGAWLAPFSGVAPNPIPQRPVQIPCFAVAHLQLPGGLAAPLLTSLLERKVPQWDHLRQILSGIFLGHDPLTGILPHIGPDWQLSLHPRPNSETPPGLPCDLVASVNYQPGDLDSPAGKSSVQSALTNGLHSLLHLIALGESNRRQPVEVDRRTADRRTLWTISSHSKSIATLALDDSSLQIASTPELVSIPPKQILQESTLYRESLAKHSPDAANSLWIHLPSLVSVLEALPDRDPQLLDLLQLFDIFWITLRIDDGGIRIEAAAQKLAEPAHP